MNSTKWLALVAAIAVCSFVGGLAIAAQPHMDNALAALQTARNELQVAEANKGGHRVRHSPLNARIVVAGLGPAIHVFR